jgi:putative flippase GtrA
MDTEQSWYKKIFFEFIKFATVGTGGVLIDFVLLNTLSWITGITSGSAIIPLNVISFSTALLFTFFFNKRWTFGDLSVGKNYKKFALFMLISLGGLSINTFFVHLISTNISPVFGLSGILWLNVAKVIATGASGTWNFLGYKNIVFRK